MSNIRQNREKKEILSIIQRQRVHRCGEIFSDHPWCLWEGIKCNNVMKSSWILFPHAPWKVRSHDHGCVSSADSHLSFPTLQHCHWTHTNTHCVFVCSQWEVGRRRLPDSGVFRKGWELHWPESNTSPSCFHHCFLPMFAVKARWLGKWITSGSFYAEPFVVAIYSYSVYSLRVSHSASWWVCFVREYKSPAICFDWSPFGFTASRCCHLELVWAVSELCKY